MNDLDNQPSAMVRRPETSSVKDPEVSGQRTPLHLVDAYWRHSFTIFLFKLSGKQPMPRKAGRQFGQETAEQNTAESVVRTC